MFTWAKSFLGLGLILLAAVAGADEEKFAGIGRPATPAEIKAWDIDVRPDFKGLPKGSGTVAKGQEIWEGQCASCHGIFGESNEMFPPIVGGTAKDDAKSGRSATLASSQPTRTTLSKLSSISTLWDYVYRAMPWNAPKTLSVEEVYAVVAYILNLGEIVPADFTLSDANMQEVQNQLGNRNGMTREHGLWQTEGKPDVTNVACMTDCAAETNVTSALPDHARNSHGNLADQNRGIGATRGIKTAAQSATKAEKAAVAAPAPDGGKNAAVAQELAKQSGCMACHGTTNKIVGPGFSEIFAKYQAGADAEANLIARVKNGGQGVWGEVPMPPQTQVKDSDIATLVRWILGDTKSQ